ncbi:restriction endonuclease subunit S [Alistipes sp. NSJ-20]|uniref:Restriction endonuclease subunit S n=2 Tax=Alistipes hominis TaxID=2763015 RepID=A0ABR7CPW5_9BACT|nr:restriction endonuclease subunit S [Alistipes hominis]
MERVEKSTTNNQYEVLSSTVKGIFSQRDYFSKDIASENNTGYKILRRGDIVLSPQNLWMGNINHNDKFDVGIVSPSYKIFTVSEEFDCYYIAFLLKTRKALYSYMSVSEQGASVVRRNLNLEAFYELTYKIPHIAEQRRIGQMLSKLKDKIEIEQTYLDMLRAQKQYLLLNLFI